MSQSAPSNTVSGSAGGLSVAAVASALAVAGVLAAGCATTLVSEPIERRADGWTVILKKLTDGPNSIAPSPGARYVPKKGMRFLHATFKIRNDSPQPRKYSYDACDMDLEQELVVPSMVSYAYGLFSQPPPRNETYAAGEESTRLLTFTYPKGRFPSRIKCAYVTFELVQVPPAPKR